MSEVPGHLIQPNECELGYVSDPNGVQAERTSTLELLEEGVYDR